MSIIRELKQRCFLGDARQPEATKFVLLSFFSLLKTIYSRVWTKPLLNDAKSPLPVDVHRSKMLLLKLPILPARIYVIQIHSVEITSLLHRSLLIEARFARLQE